MPVHLSCKRTRVSQVWWRRLAVPVFQRQLGKDGHSFESRLRSEFQSIPGSPAWPGFKGPKLAWLIGCLSNVQKVLNLWYPNSWEAGSWKSLSLTQEAWDLSGHVRLCLRQSLVWKCLFVWERQCFCLFVLFVFCINFFLALKPSPCEQLLGRVTVQFSALVETAVLLWLLLMPTLLLYQIFFLPGC